MKKFVGLILLGCLVFSPVANAALPPLTHTKPDVFIVPAAPTGLTASVSQQKVLLTWKDNAVNETHYVIERRAPGSSFAPVMNLAAGVVQWTDSNVEFGMSYVYRVQAVALHSGKIAASNYSNEVTVLVPAVHVTTGPLELHGVGFWPVFVKTGPLELHGIGFWPAFIQTGPLELHGK
jgi:hypothetical protein